MQNSFKGGDFSLSVELGVSWMPGWGAPSLPTSSVYVCHPLCLTLPTSKAFLW